MPKSDRGGRLKATTRLGRVGAPAALLVVVSAECLAGPGSIGAYNGTVTGDGTSKFDLFVAEQIAHDSNLYRLPENSAQDATVQSRSDWINSLSAGTEGEWLYGLQDVQFNAQVDNNRFQRNHGLDNWSGSGQALWNWRVGSVFLGDAGINYTRHLAGFASTGYLGRDIVSRADYYGDARWQLGPTWALFGGVAGANTSNTAAVLEGNDGRTKSANGGIEIETAVNNAIGVEYRYTQGNFSFNEKIIDGVPFDRDYQDNLLRAYVRYELTQKTTLLASAGYLKRTYTDTSIGAFSGDIWSASVQWQVTEKTQVTVAASRDLRAYVDAQSDYFVSQGIDIAPSWTASEKISLKGSIAWYDQNYIASSPSAIEDRSRHDKVNSEQLLLVYSANSMLTVQLGARYEQRNSNQELFKYHDTVATAGITFRFL